MTRTPPPSLPRERSFFSNEKSFRPIRSPTLSSDKERRKSAEGGTTKKNARRSFRRARGERRARWFPSRLVLCGVSSLRSRRLVAKTVVCLVFFELLFLSRKREKRQCRLEKSLRAHRAWSRERCDQNAREKRQRRVAYLFFRTNSTRTRSFVCACVCSRTKVESRKARARLAKTLCEIVSPWKKRKISWLLPFFCPLCSFFSLSSFLSLFGKKWREILVSQFRVLVFSSLLITTRYYGLLLPYV